MTKLPHNESILVCVHYGPHGRRLIQRGSQLSQRLGAPLYVLTVNSADGREYNQDKQQYISEWEELTRGVGGIFLTRQSAGRKIAEVIVETAREHEATQIIIGQSGQTLWQEITRGSLINDLLERIGLIDLHILAVQRYPDLLEETHEEGVAAFLVKWGNGYELRYSAESEGEDTLHGIFYRELHTDFNNGLFKTVWQGKPQYLKVIQGEWRPQ